MMAAQTRNFILKTANLFFCNLHLYRNRNKYDNNMINLSTLAAIAAITLASTFNNHTVKNMEKLPVKNADDSLTVTSPAFKKNEMIPGKYTCRGSNMNPPLHIAGIPEGTKSVTIIMDDPDAPVKGGFTHWLAWNLDQTMVDIIENYKGGTQGINGAKKKGYYGPCPPQGTHHYHFRVFALDERLKVPADCDKERLERAMKGHILAQGELVGLFSKTK
jgi:Raf kinase inhibitor-like YbhB/YbcL family protein